MDSPQKVPNPAPISLLDHDQGKGKSFGKRYLVNRLNYINFFDRTILINLTHSKYGTPLSLQAKPLPCSGDHLDCAWCAGPDLERILAVYRFQNFLIPNGKKVLLVEPDLTSLSEKGITFILPDICRELGIRKVARHRCTEKKVQVIQNGALFNGVLEDFTPLSLRVAVTAASPQMMQWVNLDFPVNLNVYSDEEILYSGDCRIIRQATDNATETFVLKPVNYRMSRFKPKKYRSTRHELVPSPNVIFDHPLTGTNYTLKVVDISGTGCSVEEDEGNSSLLPGMILPEIEVSFASSFRITCKVQVVYRTTEADGEPDGVVRCGLAFLDMDVVDHVRLLSILYQVANKNSYICSSVDMDALWNLFFEAGFIYPEKYAFFQERKEAIKETYERLYGQNPHIARHFICQEKGAISGHLAMVRFYENAWLIHHHAAVREPMKAGLNVLNQVGRFINDSHHLYSAHMQYVFCYFRPDNRFPDKVFGGLAKQLKDPKGCSLDTFAYFHFQRPANVTGGLPEMWGLTTTEPEDLRELDSFYEHESGGLMLDAFELKPGMSSSAGLTLEYQALGFKKEKHLFSLKKNGSLKAVVLVNVSDIGLNMSNLTNCAKVIVLDGDVPPDVMTVLLSCISSKYEESKMPVLMYPVAYAKKCSLYIEKLYNLWILNMRYTDQYFEYLENMIKFIQY